MKKNRFLLIFFIIILLGSCKQNYFNQISSLLQNQCSVEEFTTMLRKSNLSEIFSDNEKTHQLMDLAKNISPKYEYILTEYYKLSITDKLLVTKTKINLFQNPDCQTETVCEIDSDSYVTILKIEKAQNDYCLFVRALSQSDCSFHTGWCLYSQLKPLQWKLPYVHSDAEVDFYPDCPAVEQECYITYEGAPLLNEETGETTYLSAGTKVQVLNIANSFEKWDYCQYDIVKIQTVSDKKLVGTISTRFLCNKATVSDIDGDGIEEILALSTVDEYILNITYIKPGFDIIKFDCVAEGNYRKYIDNKTEISFFRLNDVYPTVPIIYTKQTDKNENSMYGFYHIQEDIPFTQLVRINSDSYACHLPIINENGSFISNEHLEDGIISETKYIYKDNNFQKIKE